MEKAGTSLHGLTEKAGSVGESLKGSFEGLPSLLSGGGLEGGISALSGGFSGLAEKVINASAGFGPLGIGIGVVAGAAAIAVGAIAGLALAIESIVAPQMDVIDTNFKLASSLKISTDSLMSLHAMAKTTANLAGEDLDGALQKLAKGLGEAASAGGPPAQALKALGLNAKEMANQGLDQSFTQIAEKIHQLQSPTEQITLLTELFGKSGAKLLPMFSEGAAGIEEAHKKALEFGYALTTADAAKVSAAKDRFEEIGLRIEGVKNQLTVALAPAIQFIGNSILDLLPSADKMRDFFVSAVSFVAKGFGFVADQAQNFRILVVGAADAGMQLGNVFVQSLDYVAQALVKVGKYIPGLSGISSKVADGMASIAKESGKFADAFHQEFKRVANEPMPSAGVDAWLDKIKKASDDAGKELTDKAGKAGGAMSDAFAESAQKIKATMEGMGKELDFQKFLGGAQGKQLKLDGLDTNAIKKIFEAQAGGADAGVLDSMKQLALETQHLIDATKGDDAIQGLRDKMAMMQEAAAKGIDPKFLEEIKKLHLPEGQAQQYLQLAEGIKSAEDAASKAKSLHEEIDKLHKQLEEKIHPPSLSPDEKERDGLKEQLSLWEKAQKAIENAKSPLDKYKDAMADLDKELALGFLTQEQYNAAAAKALKTEKDEEKKDKPKEQKLDKPLEAEVRRFSLDLPMNNRDLGQVQKDHLAEARKQTQYQRESRDVLKDGLFVTTSLESAANA